LMALLDTERGKASPKIGGETAEQRLFRGFAGIWCENIREEDARLRVATDPHSPAEYRVNGALRNMPEFRQAFGCKEGEPMAPAKECRVW
jgi:putative endopeptidase